MRWEWGTLARAPALQRVPPLSAEKSGPKNVLKVPKHQTPTSFHKQTDLNGALTMPVWFLTCFNLKSTEWTVKAPLSQVPSIPESGLTGAGGPVATSGSVSDRSVE